MPRDADFIVEDVTERPSRFSDDALALGFSARHQGQLLYVASWSSWLRWDGSRWVRDDTLRVYDLVRAHCRSEAAIALAEGSKKADAIAQAVTSAPTIAAVERLARSDARHARRPGDFDCDAWALNTPDGVIELRTGVLRPHRRGDHFTKATSVAPGGKCSRFLRFLLQITYGDKELVRYLRRFIGYTLVGDIREHAFIFLHGPGGNGKSVLINTIRHALGDYATIAMSDVFTVGRNDQHPTHVASLRGARMVIVPETEEGKPWAESRLKSLTAGDRVTARVMHGDPFEFDPAFTLWVAGNHRPTLRNPDPAMRRRLHLVPLTFVPAKPDTSLADLLLEELPGVLAWAVQGCLEWQRIGLALPQVVRQASAAYFEEQDSLAEWVGERCETVPGSTASSRALYTDWKAWCQARGDDPGTERRFSAELERHFLKRRSMKGREFVGVKLRPNDTGVL